MSQYNYLTYYYNCKGRTIRNEQLFPGENILYKCENIDYEDEKNIYIENTNVYFTNFRILIFTDEYICYDIPLMFIETYDNYQPYFFNVFSQNQLYITLPKIVKLNEKCPQYINENFLKTDFDGISIIYPLYVKLIFKSGKKLDKAFEYLSKAIELKDYLKSFNKENKVNEENNDSYSLKETEKMGIGLERIENLNKRKIISNSQLIANSFSGINNLRENAEKLISLAQEIRIKLSKNDEKISDINKILSKIGYVDPVTREISGSDYYYYLSNQIDDFFYDYFNKNQEIQIITLIDAYTIYNRARGANTISPKDMMKGIHYLQKKLSKIYVKNFNNEIIVLHTEKYSNENIMILIKKFMEENKNDFINMHDLSLILNVKNIILEKILIDDLLKNGHLLIDENDLEVKYYLNTILNYNI